MSFEFGSSVGTYSHFFNVISPDFQYAGTHFRQGTPVLATEKSMIACYFVIVCSTVLHLKWGSF